MASGRVRRDLRWILRLCLCFLVLGPLVVTVCSSSAVLAHVTKGLPLDTRYPAPPLLGNAAIVYDLDAAQELYAVNAGAGLPVASTTKLMTALLVLEHGHLDTMTTASYHAATIGGSTMYLRQGEELSLRDLLYGLLLPSGNDASVALAEAVGGSEVAFVAKMNARCQKLGCTNSHFTTPHGLDGYGNYASARDLLLVLRADLRFETFRRVVRTRRYNIPGTTNNYVHNLINVDEPLWWYPGVLGAKPGNTAAAGFCSALYVERGGRHIAAVILGTSDRFTDVRNLLNYALGNFTWHSPVGIPQDLEIRLYPSDDFSQDSPFRFLSGTDVAGRQWRYYIGTGYYLRSPFLKYYTAHATLGLPTSEATTDHGLVIQRFGRAVLIYHQATGTFSRV
ncbi:MAG: D-alanyl-D-alanine carboxypeptidase [Chloroflexi bacterium]|nr:D-alanyl-D-alanine carboxypeptidase [Chloroflexota bacterium]